MGPGHGDNTPMQTNKTHAIVISEVETVENTVTIGYCDSWLNVSTYKYTLCLYVVV